MPCPDIAIYPGTFDPLTNGHLDIIRRATQLAGKVIVAVARHSGKDPVFTLEERVRFVETNLPQELTTATPIEVKALDGLLMDFASTYDAGIVIRGLRAVADFDYEFQMAMMNSRLAPDVETVFLMASERHQFIASKLVKEVARLGGDVSGFVPDDVQKALKSRW